MEKRAPELLKRYDGSIPVVCPDTRERLVITANHLRTLNLRTLNLREGEHHGPIIKVEGYYCPSCEKNHPLSEGHKEPRKPFLDYTH
jgi:hypothetical protein